MKNLLEETISFMFKHNLTPHHVKWVFDQGTGASCLWPQFADMANYEYDAGFGIQNVNGRLVIEFEDGSFMIRREYDGCEGWQIVRCPDFNEGARLRIFYED